MTATTLAATTAGVAVWLFASRGAAAAARLRRLQPVTAAPPTRFVVTWPQPRRAALIAGLLASIVGGVLLGPAVVIPAGLAAGEGVRRLLVSRRDRAAALLRTDIANWCAAVAGELRIGRTPIAALESAGDVGPGLGGLLAPIVAVGSLGGDITASLRAAAERPGADALRHVAACWTVAVDAGAGLAVALQRLASALQAAERLRGEVTAQLAGARASARLLAVLPAFGLVLGQAVGAQPMHFLLNTTAGAVCAALTVVLDVIGLAWTDRIAARVPMP